MWETIVKMFFIVLGNVIEMTNAEIEQQHCELKFINQIAVRRRILWCAGELQYFIPSARCRCALTIANNGSTGYRLNKSLSALCRANNIEMVEDPNGNIFIIKPNGEREMPQTYLLPACLRLILWIQCDYTEASLSAALAYLWFYLFI